jgi:hypothetical protein
VTLKTDIIEDGSPHYGIGYNTTDRLNLVLSRETKKVLLGKCPAPFKTKTSFVDFEKE